MDRIESVSVRKAPSQVTVAYAVCNDPDKIIIPQFSEYFKGFFVILWKNSP